MKNEIVKYLRSLHTILSMWLAKKKQAELRILVHTAIAFHPGEATLEIQAIL